MNDIPAFIRKGSERKSLNNNFEEFETILAIVKYPEWVERLHPVFEGMADIKHLEHRKTVHLTDPCIRYSHTCDGSEPLTTRAQKRPWKFQALVATVIGFTITAVSILTA